MAGPQSPSAFHCNYSSSSPAKRGRCCQRQRRGHYPISIPKKKEITMKDQNLIQITVPLSAPLKIGEAEITEVIVRKPGSGELRGVKLQSLMVSDVDELYKVLPRVTIPNLMPHELDKVEPCDLVQLSGALLTFLLTPSQRDSLPRT